MRMNYLGCVKSYGKTKEDKYDVTIHYIRKGRSINATIFSGNYPRGLTLSEIDIRLSEELRQLSFDFEYNKMNIKRVSVYQNPKKLSDLCIVIEF